jgi:hypothetical protein
MVDNIAERGGICLCGKVGRISIIFGGRGPAHFKCDVCKRKYDLDGNLMEPTNA